MFDANTVTIENWDGIKKCRKKPIVIHAVQMNEPFFVDTPEGRMRGKSGDFLMFGVNEEKYPCKREIFKLTYDIVDDGNGDE